MGHHISVDKSMYEELSEPVTQSGGTPDTVETKRVETVDNDYALLLLGAFGLG